MRPAVDLYVAIPSVVYGYIGRTLFVPFLSATWWQTMIHVVLPSAIPGVHGVRAPHPLARHDSPHPLFHVEEGGRRMMNAKVQNEIAKIGLWLVGCFILGLLAAFLGYILYKGLPVLNLHFIFGKSSDILAGGGVGSQLFNSFYMLFLSMAVSIPLTLVLLNLPMLVRVTEESIRTVPHDYEEASLALGATKLQTVFKVILPSAMPGIITGIGALLILTILVFNFLLVLPLKYFQRHSVGR